MKFIAACGITALLMASSAHAADVEAPPMPYDWSGPYVGLHAGYLWGEVDVDEEGEPLITGGDIDGFVGGVLAGANYQWDPLVLGIEGDFGLTDVDGDGVPAPPEPDFSYELNWNAHVRARAGLALDRLLLFVAGGLAVADLDVDQEVQQFGTTYWGYSIGGGIDYAITDEVIVRAEYLHDEYGDEDYTENGEEYTADFNTDTVRGALIWKFMP